MRIAFVIALATLIASATSHAQTGDDDDDNDPYSKSAADPDENAPPKTLPTDPAANAPPPPTTPPSTTPPALVPPGARFDPKAEDAYHECQRVLASDVEEARKCYRRVVVLNPGTEAALKAEAALFVLDARLQEGASTSPGLIPAGRLGITTATGLFGAWNAVAVGLIVENTSGGSIPPQNVVLVTGVAAVVVGAAAGAGGYFLADALKLDEGAARLVGSSLVWGTVIGTAIAPSVSSALSSTQQQGFNAAPVNAAVLTVVGAGYLFGGAAVLVAANVTLDEAQVGLINSGGIVGLTLGILVAIDTSAAPNPDGTNVYGVSTAVTIGTALGLGTGAVVGQLLDMTWGEVLLCDLGGVLGFVGGGAVGVGLASSFQNAQPNTGLYFATGATAVGVVAGYVVAGAIVEGWRSARGAPVLRTGPRVAPAAWSSIDVRGRPVTGLGVVGAF